MVRFYTTEQRTLIVTCKIRGMTLPQIREQYTNR